MTSSPRDPLLLAAKALLAFFMGLFAVAAAILALIAVLLPVPGSGLAAELPVEGLPPLAQGDVLLLALAFLAMAALVALIVLFLLQLWRTVRSVGLGDPFIPANADRLARMGWIMVAWHVALIPTNVLLARLQRLFEGSSGSVEIDLFDGGTLLLTLVAFILARVFRHGAAMHADLEGTV